jgi:hypothetical protein
MRPYSHQAGSRSDRDAFVERGTDAPSSFDEAVIAAIGRLSSARCDGPRTASARWKRAGVPLATKGPANARPCLPADLGVDARPSVAAGAHRRERQRDAPHKEPWVPEEDVPAQRILVTAS